ncbi:MAG: hypothetical protein ACFBRM_07490 [Pikeienuella sp.]
MRFVLCACAAAFWGLAAAPDLAPAASLAICGDTGQVAENAAGTANCGSVTAPTPLVRSTGASADPAVGELKTFAATDQTGLLGILPDVQSVAVVEEFVQFSNTGPDPAEVEFKLTVDGSAVNAAPGSSIIGFLGLSTSQSVNLGGSGDPAFSGARGSDVDLAYALVDIGQQTPAIDPNLDFLFDVIDLSDPFGPAESLITGDRNLTADAQGNFDLELSFTRTFPVNAPGETTDFWLITGIQTALLGPAAAGFAVADLGNTAELEITPLVDSVSFNSDVLLSSSAVVPVPGALPLLLTALALAGALKRRAEAV